MAPCLGCRMASTKNASLPLLQVIWLPRHDALVLHQRDTIIKRREEQLIPAPTMLHGEHGSEAAGQLLKLLLILDHLLYRRHNANRPEVVPHLGQHWLTHHQEIALDVVQRKATAVQSQQILPA